MDRPEPALREVVLKAIVAHSVSYFIVGLAASWLFDYGRLFTDSSLKVMMRPLDDRWVMAGPLFQPVRGALFGCVFYLLRASLFGKRSGWLVMWSMLVVFGIVGTFGPSPGSLEGMIFTVFPLHIHLICLPEILIQSLLLSLILSVWVNPPPKKWLNWTLGVLFVILMTLPILGLVLSPAE